MIYFVALTLVLLAVILLIRAGRRQRSLGMPVGRRVYSDSGAWRRVEKPLYDADLRLTGKPDYLIEQKQGIVPVEVKYTPAAANPYGGHVYPLRGHVLQLASYCLLVERAGGSRPPYGLIHYPNRTFAIDYTPELEAELLDLLAEMRRAEQRRDAERSHNSKGRCRRCGYRSLCDQRL